MSKIALRTPRPEKKEWKEVFQGLGQRFPCITWRSHDKAGCSQAAHGATHTTEGEYEGTRSQWRAHASGGEEVEKSGAKLSLERRWDEGKSAQFY